MAHYPNHPQVDGEETQAKNGNWTVTLRTRAHGKNLMARHTHANKSTAKGEARKELAAKVKVAENRAIAAAVTKAKRGAPKGAKAKDAARRDQRNK